MFVDECFGRNLLEKTPKPSTSSERLFTQKLKAIARFPLHFRLFVFYSQTLKLCQNVNVNVSINAIVSQRVVRRVFEELLSAFWRGSNEKFSQLSIRR